MNLRVRVLPLASTLAVMLTAAPASAEIVYLTSGRTLSVKSHRYEGDSIVLSLRAGGDVTCDRSLVERIEPDEVPYIEPATPAVESQATASASQDLSVLERTPYGEIIGAVSEAHGVNPLLVRALIQVESGYKPKAKSPKGAMGLMQLMPSTARAYKVRNAFEPKANIEAGVKHLKTLIDRMEGAVDLALAAYNAGEGAVKRFNGIPPYRETRNYVSRILALAGIN